MLDLAVCSSRSRTKRTSARKRAGVSYTCRQRTDGHRALQASAERLRVGRWVLSAHHDHNMSDITRQGSPRIAMSSSISSSPSRPSPLSRPHWPYSTYTHRPASSSSSLSGSSVVAALGWDARNSGAGTPGFGRRSSHLPPSLAQDDNTRHWSFTVRARVALRVALCWHLTCRFRHSSG